MADGLLETVPAAAPSGEPGWLRSIREGAASELKARGLPGKKDEAWRFTSVREVAATAFVRASQRPADEREAREVTDAAARVSEGAELRVVLVDGSPLGGAVTAPGVSLRPLREVLERSPELLEGALGRVAPATHFAALNAAMFTDGVVLVVDGRVERPIHVVHCASGSASSPTAAYPRCVVLARRGCEATLVESFVDARPDGAAHLTNAVAEILVADGARLEHVRVSEGSARASNIGSLSVTLGRDAFYGSRVVALGGRLGRLDLLVRFEGPGSEVALDGVYHVEGAADSREHLDHHVRVVHASPHCTSRVRYRGLLDGHGRAVFDAIGVVERDAQQSAVHQENRNLLLSDDATIDTKPHLEIDADDIVASHGATVGALDDKQMFYLRSRGVPESQARDVLIYAFVRELLDTIPDEAVVERASAAILARLPNGAALAHDLREAVREPVDLTGASE